MREAGCESSYGSGLELEVARRLDSERKQAVAEGIERLQEAHWLQMRERDQQLEQMKARSTT